MAFIIVGSLHLCVFLSKVLHNVDWLGRINSLYASVRDNLYPRLSSGPQSDAFGCCKGSCCFWLQLQC